MLKRFSSWVWATIIFQLLTAAVHAMSFIIEPVATNSTEQQMLNLVNTYKMDMGNGIFRTYSEIVISLSINLTLLCLFAGVLNWFLKMKKPGIDIWKGVLVIQSIIFGILFIVLLRFAFLPPIVCVGLILLACLLSVWSLKNVPVPSTK